MNSEQANSSWIDHYRKHGYVVFEKILPLELVDAHVAACEKIQRRHGIYQKFPWRKDPLENEKAFCEELLALDDNHEPTKSLRNDPTLRWYLNTLFQEEAVLKYGWEQRDFVKSVKKGAMPAAGYAYANNSLQDKLYLLLIIT